MITRDPLHERLVSFENAHLVRTEMPPGAGTGTTTDDMEDASPAAMRSGERVPVIPELTATRVLGEVVGVSIEMPAIAGPAVELPMDDLRLQWQAVAGNEDLELVIAGAAGIRLDGEITVDGELRLEGRPPLMELLQGEVAAHAETTSRPSVSAVIWALMASISASDALTRRTLGTNSG